MHIQDKDEALNAVKTLSEDITMLASGEWVPDGESCEASLELIEALRVYIAGLDVKPVAQPC